MNMNMNIENIRAVQAHIRLHPERLDMSQFAPNNDVRRLNNCGTTGCIAGWAAAMAGHTPPHPQPGPTPGDVWTETHEDQNRENQQALVQAAADFLGLAPEPLVFRTQTSVPANNDVVRELFFAEASDLDNLDDGLAILNADDVDKALEALITTGKPVWPSVEEVMDRLDAED